jgi:hypothetical protein
MVIDTSSPAERGAATTPASVVPGFRIIPATRAKAALNNLELLIRFCFGSVPASERLTG